MFDKSKKHSLLALTLLTCSSSFASQDLSEDLVASIENHEIALQKHNFPPVL